MELTPPRLGVPRHVAPVALRRATAGGGLAPVIETKTHAIAAPRWWGGADRLRRSRPRCTQEGAGAEARPTRSEACIPQLVFVVVMLVAPGGDRRAFDRLRLPRHAGDRTRCGSAHPARRSTSGSRATDRRPAPSVADRLDRRRAASCSRSSPDRSRSPARSRASGGSPRSSSSRSPSSRRRTARRRSSSTGTGPRVVRLENLPVNASYPSGHTAASIAVYGGLALLLTSRFTNRAFRAIASGQSLSRWSLFVAISRMYRGMHHPLDVAGGVVVGVAAVIVVVFACRTAGAAAELRSGRTRDEGRRHRALRQDARRRAPRAPPRARSRGRRRPVLVRGAEEPQGARRRSKRALEGGRRARLRLGRRRHGAALRRRARRLERAASRSSRPAPRTCSPRNLGIPQGHRAGGRDRASRRAAHASTSAASTASASR